MKRSILVILAGALLFLGFSCQAPKSGGADPVNDSMELIVEPGENWQGKMKIFIFSVSKTPQIAAWIEDANGRYVTTVTVTNRSSKKNWRSAPKEGRPEALPVWNHRLQMNQARDDLDTVSTATPKGPVEAKIDGSLLARGSTYSIYLEINHSFDYNDHWTKENSGVNGQPSLLYHAQFTAGQPCYVPLTPEGYGSVDGYGGEVTSGLEHVTSALSIVRNVHFIGK